MNNSLPETVLITGASYGIGYELARVFAAHGHPLVLTARSHDKLEAIRREFEKQYNVPVQVITKDLSHPLSPEEIYRELKDRQTPVEILVNNAGFGSYGKFIETDLDHELEMIQVNISALTHLTKLFLKDMTARKKGRILNVASTAAFQPGPIMAVYYATKAYVLSFSRALREEFSGTGISVTALCPGPTASGFQKRADIGKIPLFHFGGLVTSAEFVARKGYEGLMRGRAVVIPGWMNRLMVWGAKISPAWIAVKVVRLLQKAKK